MAWMAPDDIPRDFLAPLASDAVALNRALGVLHTYNMVSFTEQGSVSVHRLVQTVLRSRTLGREDAERALQLAVPKGKDDAAVADQWQRVLPHIDALAESSTDGSVPTTETAEAYLDTAQYLFRQQRDGQSVALREQILLHREQVFGDTHRNTLASRSNLASAYSDAGAPERAIPLLKSILTQDEGDLGDTHPDTLIVRNNLAMAYYTAGDTGQAIPLLEVTLTQSEQVLGDTHNDTLTSRHNLGGAYVHIGAVEQAVPLLEKTLRQYVQIRGENHLTTLTVRDNLALAYAQAGDLNRAISLLETNLPMREQLLSDSHPSTEATRAALSQLRQARTKFLYG
jgi:tetratricopeptide (TPR) repeat protein